MSSLKMLVGAKLQEEGVEKVMQVTAATYLLLLAKEVGDRQAMEMVACLAMGCAVTTEEINEQLGGARADLAAQK